ncbi:MAG: hypothetical protein AAF226_05355 [Verrucomicrobiota bacterium]
MLLALLQVVCVQAQSEDLIVRELTAALEMADQKMVDYEKQLVNLEGARQAMVESVAEAVRVSEENVVASRELRLKLEALGVDIFDDSGKGIESRLLKSVRDLDITKQQNTELVGVVQMLSVALT